MKTSAAVLLKTLSVGLLAICGTLYGRAVISSPAQSTTTKPTAGETGERSPSAARIESVFPPALPLLKRGPLSVRPHLAYGILYGDGILRVPGEPANTTMQTISPGVLFEVGAHWTLDYTLTRSTYSSRLLSDTNDHNASAIGAMSYAQWALGLSLAYGSNSPTLVETGSQTHEETYSTGLNASREIGERSRVELVFDRFERSASPVTRSPAWTGSDWVQWSVGGWFRNRLTDRLSVGLGVTEGYDEVSDNPNMAHTRPQGEITWHPTEKISLAVTGGIEIRKSTGPGARRDQNSIYRATFDYSPLPTTSLTLSAHQEVSTSYFADQTSKSNGWNASLHQRLLKRFYLVAGVVYGTSEYLSNTTLFDTGRHDDFEAFTLRLSTAFLKRGTISLSYERSENTSMFSAFSFKSNQVGANVSYRF